MKKIFIAIIFVIAFFRFSTTQAASVTVDVGDLRYTVDTEAQTAELYGLKSYTIITNLVIPDLIDYNGSQIPVTSIRDEAFSWGSNLKGSLTIGNNVQTIGKLAFDECSGFTGSLIIPDNVQIIGDGAFFHCSGFTGSLTIGDNVQAIGDYAFYNCSGFKGSLTISDNVQTIGESAFWGCSGFTGLLTIGANMQTIGESAFARCSGFTGPLTIGANVQTIGEAAFVNCSGFTGSLTIGANVQTIGESAFARCSGFTGPLTIGANVQTIGDYAFSDCSGFTGSLTIPNSVQSIGKSAFEDCSGFTGSLTIGDNVQTIGDNAFKNCSDFTGSLIIPDNVQTIGNYAFQNCSGFTGSLIIPDKVQTIGEEAFRECSGFTGSLIIGDNVQTIGDNAFWDCSGFTGELIIPESVNEIGKGCFFGCDNITSLVITSSNTVINYHAFQCKGLQSVTCLGTVPPKCVYKGINDYVFGYSIIYNKPLYVPSESITLYKTATEWEKFTNINPIPVVATDISLNKSELSLFAGQEETLTASLIPEGATTEIVWSTEDNNDDVISVDQNGKVTALAPGEATVVASAGNVSAKCQITVYGADDVTVKPGDGTSEGNDEDTLGNNTENGGSLIGNDLTLRVNQTAAIDLNIPEGLSVEPKFDWALDNDGAELVNMTVAGNTLSATFRGLKVGQTGYTVSIVGGNGNIEAVKGKITVIAETPMTSLRIEPASISLAQNALPVQLATIVTPDNASMKEFSWESSVPTVATISQTGELKPVGQGHTIITVTALDGSGLTATCEVTVTEPIDENFEFDFDESVMGGKEGISLYIGDTYQFTPKAQDGYVLPDVINWSSSDNQKVSVNESGLVTALAIGTATITASATVNDQEVKATCEVTVIPIPAESITIEGEDIHTLKETQTLQLIATVLPETATYQEVEWNSSDPAIATVSNNGFVTAISVGEVTITAVVKETPSVKTSYPLTIEKRLLGDANDNGVVNVADVGTISDYIVKKPVYNFCFVNADVVTDGQITTADVTATIDIIFNDIPTLEQFAKARKLSSIGNNELMIDNFNPATHSIVGVNLRKPSEFTGLQGSILIPEGMTVMNVTKGRGASNHILNYNITEQGTVEFILYSLQNAPFEDGSGSLIELEIQAERNCGDLTVENILASDSAANEYTLSFSGGKNNDVITQLESVDSNSILIYSISDGIVILNAQSEKVNIFNIAGEHLVSSVVRSNMEFYPLTSGIYIVTVKSETAKLIVK